MPFEVRMSAVGMSHDLFEKAVQDHIAALHAHTKTVGKPRPTASHAEIEHALKRVQVRGKPDTYVPDYTYTDDTPPEPEVHDVFKEQVLNLEQKKELLVRILAAKEFEIKDKICPRRRQRLLIIKNNMAAEKPEAERTDEEKADMALWLGLVKQYQAVEIRSAEIETAIDDLTEADIDNWQMPSLM